jgi:hypothetical protein
LGRHQHAGRADAALGGAVRMEGILQGAELAVLGQALDGDDRATGDLRHRHEAGADLAAVEPHRAGAAVAGVATDLGAGEAEVVAQDVGQAAHGIDVEVDLAAVEREGDLLGRRSHRASSATVRLSSVSAASLR